MSRGKQPPPNRCPLKSLKKINSSNMRNNERRHFMNREDIHSIHFSDTAGQFFEISGIFGVSPKWGDKSNQVVVTRIPNAFMNKVHGKGPYNLFIKGKVEVRGKVPVSLLLLASLRS